MVLNLQKIGKTKLMSLCGDIRRCTTTLARIEIISAKKFIPAMLKKYMVVQSSTKDKINASLQKKYHHYLLYYPTTFRS
jgi:hypothetical protein